MTDLLAAGVAGLLAAQVMEMPAYLQKQAGLGVRQDIFAETGAILRVPKRWQRVAGWFGHAVTAVVVAMLYRVLFEAVQADSHLVAWGIVGGVVHFGVGGLVVGASRCCTQACRTMCRPQVCSIGGTGDSTW